ncbi:unnamed protein product [Tuber melanosporum]|uniref:(Perigord truffle) hypothetical protein n=1 Tax=Tuber melanosporum (strain Mel28) TaxID=656061 RepID=D5GKK8_TUBMM|nr:uncharacterized protein GSTUM_00009615001 [Tuber melanosporum]CAZ85051.1 unnamed protein product [Tuber melanosporum]
MNPDSEPPSTDTEPPLRRLFYGVNPPVYLPSLTCAEFSIAQVEAHLKHRKAHTAIGDNEHEEAVSFIGGGKKGPPTLAQLATARIVSTLRYDMKDGVRVLVQSCPEKLLRPILESPRLHYIAFRTLLHTHDAAQSSQGIETSAWAHVQRLAGEDVDSWVLRNEKFIRQMPPAHQNSMLVSLDEAAEIWPDAEITSERITLWRRKPPREAFTCFDELRARKIELQPSSKKFGQTFKRLTNGIFEGLNWNNVVIGGGMVLATMQCLSEEDDKACIDSDIDLWIHGLNPEEANKKVREIYNVWWRNLNPERNFYVMKNAKTLTLMSDYPERRIQIILKMTRSEAEVLLNFDLDPCAMCWNGKEVRMLPRCARALETGYTVFTMDLVYGHHLGDRRATQEMRVLKYASRGFGILIPASLMNTLTVDFDARKPKVSSCHESHFPGRSGGRYGKPRGEIVYSGKKAVKRIAFLAQDMVHRFYLGSTPLSALIRAEEDLSDEESDDGQPPYGSEELIEESDGEGGVRTRRVIKAIVSNVNGRKQSIGQPGGREGVGAGFEVFMRMAALFKYEAEDRLRIDRDTLCSLAYDDPDTYDDTPRYLWGPDFKFENLSDEINAHNNSLFANLREAIEELLGYDSPHGRDWKGYLSRRIRRVMFADNIDEIFQKQITIPICVPAALEEYIENTMRDVCDEHGMPWSDEFKVLIPIHNRNTTTRPAPPVGRWNYRYWVIGNITMWAKWDPRIDEIFEVLWSIFHMETRPRNFAYRCDPDEEEDRLLAKTLAAKFDQRIIPASSLIPQVEQIAPGSWPDAREKELFREWMMCFPQPESRTYSYETHHTHYIEGRVRTFAEELWWNEEVDGASDGGNWAEWETPSGGLEVRQMDKKRKRVDSGGLEGMVAE